MFSEAVAVFSLGDWQQDWSPRGEKGWKEPHKTYWVDVMRTSHFSCVSSNMEKLSALITPRSSPCLTVFGLFKVAVEEMTSHFDFQAYG